jgi:phospholipid/cholesterol/gamma-HCH transport system substrate-binding protein
MVDVKKQLQWSKLKVGSVITLALIVLIMTVFFAGNIEDLLSKKVELKAAFRDVGGLRKSAPIWIFGTEVGSVKGIDLSPTYGTIVTMSVNKGALPYIRKDSNASILTMGLLGDKYVEITGGSQKAESIRPGEMIQGVAQIEFQDVMKTGAVTIKTMTEFIKKLEALVTKIETGEGTFAKFLTDPSIHNNLNKTTHSLSLVAEELRTSQGTLRMLIDDPALYKKMMTVASSLEDTTRMIKESSGTLKRLVEDPTVYNKILESATHVEGASSKLEGFVTKLEGFATKMEESQGTLKKLIEDPGLYEDLDKGAKQLSSILGQIDKGEGLATAFLKDKELVKELDETLVQFKKMTHEIETLVQDIKAHPRKYLKFSVF